jgi:hypothetical protein
MFHSAKSYAAYGCIEYGVSGSPDDAAAGRLAEEEFLMALVILAAEPRIMGL